MTTNMTQNNGIVDFVRQIAELRVDGEIDVNGNEVEWENDDAVDTLFDIITQARSATATVHVVSIDHKYGTTVFVNTTHQGANETLHRWVVENWTDMQQPSGNPEQDIETYFTDFSGESYWITEETIGM